MTFMSFDSKVDSCISPNNNYSKNNSRFQQNSLMDGLPDASKKKNIKNIAESTLMFAVSCDTPREFFNSQFTVGKYLRDCRAVSCI